MELAVPEVPSTLARTRSKVLYNAQAFLGLDGDMPTTKGTGNGQKLYVLNLPMTDLLNNIGMKVVLRLMYINL